LTQDEKKRAVAEAAIELIEPGSVVGVGTGSTTDHFIDGLARIHDRVEGTVASSVASAERLASCGLRVLDLNDVDEIPIYVDGADEATIEGWLIKGGGGALTREKIVAAASRRFVCIVDDTKRVDRLGAFPLPVEVVPMATGIVSRALERLGGRPQVRSNVVTDNGNSILDVSGLDLSDPVSVERRLNQIVGVVASGLFCERPADLLLVATTTGIDRYEPSVRPS
jgi:ribose 5-phosphate isomerase A